MIDRVDTLNVEAGRTRQRKRANRAKTKQNKTSQTLTIVADIVHVIYVIILLSQMTLDDMPRESTEDNE